MPEERNVRERDKAIDMAVGQIEKQFGKGAIMRLGQDAVTTVPHISTGSIGIDHALGIGGVPRGRVVEIFGPEASGKTTLTLQIIAQAQRRGGTAAFVDAEHALDPTYAKKLGVDLDSLLVAQPDHGEQALEIVEVLVRSGGADVVVVDSVAALVPKAEIDGDMGEAQVGLQARLMSQALRKLTAVVARSSTCLVFINQLREKIGVMFGSPETTTRIAQYEMAYRMQASVPELTDLSDEPDSVFERYGPDSRTPGTFAANCLLARRLAERDVRFIQLFHRGWDMHTQLPRRIQTQAKDVDQPQAALVMELKERGMLDDTLVVWGGEFGRTIFCQGRLTEETYGRDHHPRSFTIWMAGGGVKPGTVYGETDDFAFNIVKDPVHIHDLHATMLHLLGIDHTRLTYQFQGRDFRLTDVHGKIVNGVLA